MVYGTTGIVVVALICNLALPRNHDKWGKAFQFSVHAYEQQMSTSTQFAGPFMSTVQVLPSLNHTLSDHTRKSHVHCSREMFPDKMHMQKCKTMHSAPVYLGNIQNSWSVLGAQSTFVLTKHMMLTFVVLAILWCSEFALTNQAYIFRNVVWNPVIVRNLVLFAAVVVFVGSLASDVTSDPKKTVALGSITTAFSLVVVALLIICFEYATTGADVLLLYSEEKTAKNDLEKNGANEVVDFIKPKKEHMHRNIYLSYSCLLTLPMVAVLILSSTRTPIVDVHIQLVFLSFIFYATLDVFQTRTTAVLLCLKYDPRKAVKPDKPDEDQNRQQEDAKEPLASIKFFVVLAFFLCKCFALMPALVLMQTKYNPYVFQTVTLVAHYVVLFGFALADLVHITFPHAKMPPPDLLKLFVMLVYACLVFFATCTLDPVAS